MGIGRFDPGCCSCGLAIGTDYTMGSWISATYGADKSYIINLAGNSARFPECKLILSGFVGDFSVCGSISQRWLGTDDRPRLRDWIEAGGRLCHISEYYDGAGHCEGDPGGVDLLLSDLGSTMRHNANIVDAGCHGPAIAGGANIAAGMSVGMGGAATISGGTTVFYGRSGTGTIFAVEKLGAGYLFLCCDSNMRPASNACSPPNATFWRRLYDYTDDQII